MNRRERRWLLSAIAALVIASSLPYLIAWVMTPRNAHFTGLIFNPLDGNSYLAKMRQGLEGSWRFHLAFTPERSDGAYIFLYHLLLGHIGRWSGLPPILIYHAARVLTGAAMLLAIYGLASRLSDSAPERGTMFLLTSLGSGLGWLVGPLGIRTADLWVPEAFPIYALMANAHFPLAIALMVGMAICGLQIVKERENRETAGWGAGMVLAAVALGMVQPFGLLPVFGGLGVMLAARTIHERRIPWRALVWVVGAGLAASPYPLYAQWAIRSDPVLAAWNAQNATPSPPIWDWALSYGVVLLLALPGTILAARRGSDGDWLLLGWAGVTLVGMYLPLPLQRRLSLGLGVPLGILAGMGWWSVTRLWITARRRQFVRSLVIALSALTPTLLLTMAVLAAQGGEPWFYLSDGEWVALQWLRREAQPDAVVLCSPQMGAFVPAWAGQPVVYGHPFETIDAERRQAKVEAYWSGETHAGGLETFLQENRVRYIFVGPRERRMGAEEQGSRDAGEVVFEARDVKVYEVR